MTVVDEAEICIHVDSEEFEQKVDRLKQKLSSCNHIAKLLKNELQDLRKVMEAFDNDDGDLDVKVQVVGIEEKDADS